MDASITNTLGALGQIYGTAGKKLSDRAALNVCNGSEADVSDLGARCLLSSGRPTSNTLPRDPVSLRSANGREADLAAWPA